MQKLCSESAVVSTMFSSKAGVVWRKFIFHHVKEDMNVCLTLKCYKEYVSLLLLAIPL